MGQIDSEDSVEMSLQVEARLARLRLGPVFRGGRGTWGWIQFRLELLQILRDFAIAVRDPVLVLTKRGQRLAQGE